MEPLKEMFNAAFYKQFAAAFKNVYPEFREKNFFKEVTGQLTGLELNERLRNTTVILHRYLPADYQEAVSILMKAAPLLKTGYTSLVLPDFVGVYGRHDIHYSLQALKFFTVFGSSEFAIREFLKLDLNTTVQYMTKWAADPDPHVRRLSSEGSRPRLPWSFRLDTIVADPSLTRPILQQLRSDDHLYVRKSVANHLNDISKDHPEYMLQLIRSWDLENAHTRWIVKHACRTLIKKGDPAALQLFSVRHGTKAVVKDLKIQPSSIRLGQKLNFSFKVAHLEKTAQKLVVDYAISYARPSKMKARKVFKLKELTLQPKELCTISKNQLFRDFTTRTHYAGRHHLEIIVNGKTFAEKIFMLVKE